MRSKLVEHYLAPDGSFVLESLIATTYNIQWEFVEEELLPVALGVRAPTSRMRAFRLELERKLSDCNVSILYDPRGCDRLSRLSARVDAIPVLGRKQHAKVSLLLFSRRPPSGRGLVERRARLLVGSANLTRPGFRENIEVCSVFEFGGKGSASGSLLRTAIDLVTRIGDPITSPQLRAQLQTFRGFAAELGNVADSRAPVLVEGDGVVSQLRTAWTDLGRAADDNLPESMTIVSPFWSECDNSATPVVELVRALGVPSRLELVCSADLSPDGKSLLPILPRALARGVKNQLKSTPVAVRPAQIFEPEDEDIIEDADDSAEESGLGVLPNSGERPRRALHAKIITVRGKRGCALYIGSSNCTRRGLTVRPSAALNWEAGLVYRLGPRESGFVDELITFAGPPVEIPLSGEIDSIEPTRDPDSPIPDFLREVVAAGTSLSIHFVPGADRPDDLSIQMADARDPHRYYSVLQGGEGLPRDENVDVALESCPQVDDQGKPLQSASVGIENLSATVRVRWGAGDVEYPIRFDDKATLPTVAGSRPFSEGDLIHYFLTGRYPADDGGFFVERGDELDANAPDVNEPLDTRRILSYFMRTFVDALPGIESAMMEGARSQPALHATLFGPTSPVLLVERAIENLSRSAGPSDPQKTPVAVGFQVTEIVAAMIRCKSGLSTDELRAEFDAAIARCLRGLDQLCDRHPELRGTAFERYRNVVSGRSP